MGIYDREYYRGASGRSGLLGGSASAWKWLLAINIAVYLLELLTKQGYAESSAVTEWLSLSLSDIQRGQVWRLITAAFCHSEQDIFHIAFNMFLLVMFGRRIEELYGSREFLAFYLAAALSASLCFLALDLVMMGPGARMLGASGAVMGVVILYAMIYPRQTVLLMMVFPIEMRWLALGIVILDLHPLLRELQADGYHDGIAHAAHLGGAAFGFLYRYFNLRLGNLLAGLRLPSFKRLAGPRRRIRVYQETQEESLDQRVDEILEKISQHGESSLSDEERNTLIRASRRYQGRR